MRYRFIRDNAGEFPVAELCERLEVSRSGYYAWLNRGPSARDEEDAALKDRVLHYHGKSKERYGHRPIHSHLRDEGLACGRDRTLRLMREPEIAGVQKPSFKPLGADGGHAFGYSPNLLRELGEPERPDQVWVADTTYLRVSGGWAYLAAAMDLCSRRVIGWSVSDRNDSELVCRALRAAVMARGGSVPPGVLHHSDRGSTYACLPYERLLRAFGMRQSMSAKGNCYDNAPMESFYGRYKSSSVGKAVFADTDQARANAFEYIEVFYNRFRKHSSLGYKNPVEFEENFSPPMGGEPASLAACPTRN